MATDSIFVADVMSEKLLAKFPHGPLPPQNTFSTFPFDLLQVWWVGSVGQVGLVPPIGSGGTLGINQMDPVITFFLGILGADPLADSTQGRWAQYWDLVDLGTPIPPD